MANIYKDIIAAVGNTPLVQVNKLIHGATVLAKLESRNPLASVKDRIGVAMIEAAERDGQDQARRRSSSSPPAATRASPWPSSVRPAGIAAADHAGLDEHRAAQGAQGAGRRARADPGGRGHEGRHQEGDGDRRGGAGGVHAAAVREPGQPGGPSQNDGRGDLARTPTARSTSSSPASAPAARSPASPR